MNELLSCYEFPIPAVQFPAVRTAIPHVPAAEAIGETPIAAIALPFFVEAFRLIRNDAIELAPHLDPLPIRWGEENTSPSLRRLTV